MCVFKGTLRGRAGRKTTSAFAAARDGPRGVFYSLALTFGTLLSSQGTEASFAAGSPAPPGFPFDVHYFSCSSTSFPIGCSGQRGWSRIGSLR